MKHQELNLLPNAIGGRGFAPESAFWLPEQSCRFELLI